jgi:ribonuclease HI
LIEGYFDGLCEPKNPGGIATYGYYIKMDHDKIEGFGLATEPWSKNATNNVAEYTGLLCLLIKLKGLKIEEATIYGDSQLVVNQLNGIYKIKSQRLVKLFEEINQTIKSFRKIEIKWIPREMNKRADYLTRVAYKLAIEGKLKKVGCD